MTDKLQESDLTLLQREVDDLREKITSIVPAEAIKHDASWLTRLWRRLFGRLIYDGPETCGQCRYWKAPYGRSRVWNDIKHQFHYYYGDCRLLHGRDDTIETDSCKQFEPNKRYMRRVYR
jgi:hypothetical protein